MTLSIFLQKVLTAMASGADIIGTNLPEILSTKRMAIAMNYDYVALLVNAERTRLATSAVDGYDVGGAGMKRKFVEGAASSLGLTNISQFSSIQCSTVISIEDPIYFDDTKPVVCLSNK